VYDDICKTISARQQEFLQIKCPPVLLAYLEIVHGLCEQSAEAHSFDEVITQKHFTVLADHCRNTLKSQLETLPFRKQLDVCYGELRKEIVQFALSKISV